MSPLPFNTAARASFGGFYRCVFESEGVTFVKFWSLIEAMVKQARAQTSNDAAVFRSFGLNLHSLLAAQRGTVSLDRRCDLLKPLSQVVPCGVSEP